MFHDHQHVGDSKIGTRYYEEVLRELDFEDARDRKAAALAIDFQIDRYNFGIKLVAHRCGEDCKTSTARGPSVCDVRDGLALWFISPICNVNAERAVALMNRSRP